MTKTQDSVKKARKPMTKSQRTMLIRIFTSAGLFAVALLVTNLSVFSFMFAGSALSVRLIKLALFLPSYIIIGWDILLRAAKGIVRGGIFDEYFLMSIATLGAFIIGEYAEAVVVMLLYQVGEFFQSYAVGRSRDSIAELMDIRPDYANIMKNGEIVQVDPYEVSVGDHIIVTAGEKVPLDGIVVEGTSSLDTSALTGESVPRNISPGEEALSGCINLSGALTIEVTKEFDQSTVTKILELVENASSNKAQTENFITRFARVYTPIVVIAAALLAIVPPLVIPGATFADYVHRALSFLVVSCPCALVISVPLSFFGGIGGASRSGILVKGSNYLEALGMTETVVMDKTGTLTHGEFEVQTVYTANGWTEDELLDLLAHTEFFSNHPISLSLQSAHSENGNGIDGDRVSDFEEIAGHGVTALVDGKEIAAGNLAMMEKQGLTVEVPDSIGTVVYMSVNGEYAGYVDIADRIKDDAREAIQSLNARGVKTVMLTGDTQAVADKVAKELGIRETHAELLPADKVTELEQIMANKTDSGKVAFVGDGINDAPVLALADIGIAMGALGSDAAIEAADIVLMDDKPSKIVSAMDIARSTMRIVRQNIIFALGVKLIVLVLSALNITSMWAAVFADVGVSILAILNAMRALNVGKKEDKIVPPSATTLREG